MGWSLDEWLAHCERLHPKTIELTLERVATVKARLGLQFDAATPVVVVGGTNGKGSTCAMLESIALAAGYRVGLFSKPHLVRFEERCRIDGRYLIALIAVRFGVPCGLVLLRGSRIILRVVGFFSRRHESLDEGFARARLVGAVREPLAVRRHTRGVPEKPIVKKQNGLRVARQRHSPC